MSLHQAFLVENEQTKTVSHSNIVIENTVMLCELCLEMNIPWKLSMEIKKPNPIDESSPFRWP